MNSSPPTSDRARFTSPFGALMALIGVAVGLGNVWRFPYMAGAFGGGAFLLVYVVILMLFGVPALMAELSLGRLTRRGPMGAFRAIGMKGGRAVGWALLVTVLMALSYYSVVVGWVLRYLWLSITGRIAEAAPAAFFDSVLGGFAGQAIATGIVLTLVAAVLILGVARGVQRVSVIGMPLLFLLLIGLIARSLTLPGAAEGLRYYLVPDFSKLNASVVAAALGQVFFSLGLGGTFLVTYASYLDKDIDMRRSAVAVAVGDASASLLAGLVILPAAIAVGIQVNSGPPLTFVTAPAIFAAIPAGAPFAVLFFGLLFVAAFLSGVAGFEVLVAGAVDELGWARKPAVIAACCAAFLLSAVPMLSLDYILKSDLFWGSTMQPVGSALALIALAWVVGRSRTLAEVNRGARGQPLGTIWYYWIKYGIPVGIAIVLGFGLHDMFETFVK